MRFFGRPWALAVGDGAPFEPVPVGADCGYGCGNPIGPNDDGVLLLDITMVEPDPGSLHFDYPMESRHLASGTRIGLRVVPWHIVCFIDHIGVVSYPWRHALGLAADQPAAVDRAEGTAASVPLVILGD